LIRSAFRASRSALATSRRQKCDDGDEEKFDCDEHARRFDLIRSVAASASLFALSDAPEIDSPSMIACARSSVSILGDKRKIWAERELACPRARRAALALRALSLALRRGSTPCASALVIE
jgi:hypothetical protein